MRENSRIKVIGTFSLINQKEFKQYFPNLGGVHQDVLCLPQEGVVLLEERLGERPHDASIFIMLQGVITACGVLPAVGTPVGKETTHTVKIHHRLAAEDMVAAKSLDHKILSGQVLLSLDKRIVLKSSLSYSRALRSMVSFSYIDASKIDPS